ncbi:VOC family protein [Catenuloplanes indicus]|uniref:Glyoxalase superfamily protein PhnB n=1 Tax=Catenuloplanes indicus TaxID=137267 RepID=A0AAE3VY27_9ACTN|nr:VOC family protein [Catenuloplanes indicus]MDQ0365392.1 putative glyoxalase superfamily protein PhnB [Catenuloplanes indicus]
MSETMLLPAGDVPAGAAVLNPFVIVDGAAGLIEFVCGVFDVTETVEARTPMPDGRLIHAQVRLGTVDLMLADRLAGWPARHGLLQVWVRDAGAVLERAVARGARPVTPPVPFYGETTLARVLDPWGNLWWLWSPAPGRPDPVPAWEGGDDTMFTTLDATLRELADRRSVREG